MQNGKMGDKRFEDEGGAGEIRVFSILVNGDAKGRGFPIYCCLGALEEAEHQSRSPQKSLNRILKKHQP